MMDPVEKVRKLGEKLGIPVITVQDKLNMYMSGLKLIRGKPGCEIVEVGQWESIGDLYRGMEQRMLAKAAYESALKALEKVRQSKYGKDYVGGLANWEKNLKDKLKQLV